MTKVRDLHGSETFDLVRNLVRVHEPAKVTDSTCMNDELQAEMTDGDESRTETG